MAEFPVTKPELIVPSCVNLSTYIQGMSDYEVRCYYTQLVRQWATEWAQMQTEWGTQQEAFKSFKTYVNGKIVKFQSWFDNLDVQSEINNKIDEMVSDGTFLTIIQSTVNSQTQAATDAWLQENMTPGAGAPALDSSLTLANAAAQAKVTGDKIREFSDKLAYVSKANGTHYYDKSALTVDGYWDYTAKKYSESDWKSSEKLDVSDSTGVWLYVSQVKTSAPAGISFFDDNDDLIFTVVCTHVAVPNQYIPFPAGYNIKSVIATCRPDGLDDFYIFTICDPIPIPNYLTATQILTSDSLTLAGAIRGDNGDVYYSSTWSCTDYIPCGDILNLYLPISLTSHNAVNDESKNFVPQGIAFYDNTKTFISSVYCPLIKLDMVPNLYFETWVKVPANAKYFRTSFRNSSFDKFIVYANYKHIMPSPLSLFNKVGVIGDSIACGWMLDKSSSPSRRNIGISWPQQLGRKYWGTVLNLGASGVSPVTWFDPDWEAGGDEGNQYCYKQYLTAEACDLYIIGLGLNPSTLGSISDVNKTNYESNGATFYGQYARIIQMINHDHPNALVLCLTNPLNKIPSMDNAVKEICALDYINAYVVDLYADYAYLFDTPETQAQLQPDGLHYTPYGYTLLTEATDYALSDFLRKNTDILKYVGLNSDT